ncbi:MAG: hypothetical protein WA957_02700 [Alteraurantiacibacter sp.]
MDWARRLSRFEKEAFEIFATIETSTARSINLYESYSKLHKLNLRQDALFREALKCVEHQLYRSAHVLSWSAFIDCVHGLLESDQFELLNKIRDKWKISELSDLTERYGEHALIEALHPMKVVNKAEMKSLLGMLSERNECAHPTDYVPDLNETLGYISKLFLRIAAIEKRFPLMLIV